LAYRSGGHVAYWVYLVRYSFISQNETVTSNAEWRFFRRNPKGWDCFCAQRRDHSLM
jgi:hypothetical protein